MHWWEPEKILAGKDLKAGGTWLAVSDDGRFAAITKYKELINGKETQKPGESWYLITLPLKGYLP
ncbi:MAG: hypothetical protein CM1200mP12_09700 [Gammaproteobacteria bacterium]|nr:MAG: hypothetical protein CM1200mP12_09700 [Gammaproteobacteria bacterium]